MKKYPLRGLATLIKLFIVIGITLFLIQYPGSVTIHWMDFQIDMGLGILFAAIFTGFVFLLFLSYLWRQILSFPHAWGRTYRRRQRHKGKMALIKGITAIASGEPEEAFRYSKKASRCAPNQHLNHVLAAQSAFLSGRVDEATEYFSAMTRQKATEFLGLRGLYLQAKNCQDWKKARVLLEQAFATKPNSPWVMNQLMTLDLKLGSYDRALPMIDQMTRKKVITKPEGSRFQALIHWMQAQEALDDNDTEKYEKLLAKAYEGAPNTIGISLEYIAFLHQSKKSQRALKTLISAYSLQPHPELGKFLKLIKSDLSPIEYYREVEKVVKSNPEHRESHVLMAQAALKSKLWGQARHHLDIFMSFGESQRGCRLRAELEESENPTRPEISRRWWKKAMHASKDANWACTSCRSTQKRWHVFCVHCSAMDTISWRYSENSDASPQDLLMPPKTPVALLS